MTEWLAPVFLAFNRNGLDCTIEFSHGEALLGQDLQDIMDLAAAFGEEAEVSSTHQDDCD